MRNNWSLEQWKLTTKENKTKKYTLNVNPVLNTNLVLEIFRPFSSTRFFTVFKKWRAQWTLDSNTLTHSKIKARYKRVQEKKDNDNRDNNWALH